MLTLEQIKEKHGASRFNVPIPEWGGDALARRLEVPDLLALHEAPATTDKRQRDSEYLIQVIKLSLINDDGSQLIDAEHEYLLRESPMLVARIGQELVERNNLATDSKKNLATSDDSPSDSA